MNETIKHYAQNLWHILNNILFLRVCWHNLFCAAHYRTERAQTLFYDKRCILPFCDTCEIRFYDLHVKHLCSLRGFCHTSHMMSYCGCQTVSSLTCCSETPSNKRKMALMTKKKRKFCQSEFLENQDSSQSCFP